MNTTQRFPCFECQHTHFTFDVDPTAFYLTCDDCLTTYLFEAGSIFKHLTHVNGARFNSGQTQEPVATVAASTPDSGHLSTPLPDSIPQTTVQMLDFFRFIFGIDTANGHYQDILFDVIKSHLFSHSMNFDDLTVYEIRTLMMTADSIFDHLMISVLSTESVDK